MDPGTGFPTAGHPPEQFDYTSWSVSGQSLPERYIQVHPSPTEKVMVKFQAPCADLRVAFSTLNGYGVRDVSVSRIPLNATGIDVFGPLQISGADPISYYKTNRLLSAGESVFAAVDPKDGYGGDATSLSFRISLVCQ